MLLNFFSLNFAETPHKQDTQKLDESLLNFISDNFNKEQSKICLSNMVQQNLGICR